MQACYEIIRKIKSRMKQKVITIFGATGFIGSQVVHILAKQGYTLKLVTSHPYKCASLKISGDIGQITAIPLGQSQESLECVIAESYAVVNCTGILQETGRRSFMGTHCDFPAMLARICKKQNIRYFVHISALGVDRSHSRYAKSKYAGEKAVLKTFPNATIFRPSIVFGPKDNFFNRFARMAKILPFLPLIGGGKTLFQPVYVGDVARAVCAAIKDHKTGIYELGGTDSVSFKDLLKILKFYTGSKVILLPIPFWFAYIQAFFMRLLPTPPLTVDQVTSLKTHNIVNKNVMTLAHLGVKPTRMETILPTYLEHSR